MLYAVGMGSMERVDRILQAESTITDPAQPKPVVFNEAIRLEKVSFRYAEEWVLRDVDLTIRKGQTVALVGIRARGRARSWTSSLASTMSSRGASPSMARTSVRSR